MNNTGMLEERLGTRLKNKDLLYEALTHESYRGKNPHWPLPTNDRLQRLGKPVMQMIGVEHFFPGLTDSPGHKLEYLYKMFTDDRYLSGVGNQLDLNSFLFFSWATGNPIPTGSWPMP
jgi:dsRNA-specific ribonuclease